MAANGSEKLRLKALNIEKGSSRVSFQVDLQEQKPLTF